jgi:hypothetical protein
MKRLPCSSVVTDSGNCPIVRSKGCTTVTGGLARDTVAVRKDIANIQAMVAKRRISNLLCYWFVPSFKGPDQAFPWVLRQYFQ